MKHKHHSLSDALPLLFRKSGGAALGVLLATVDEEWNRKCSHTSPMTWGDDLVWLGQATAWFGWDDLLAVVGGVRNVVKPARLLELPSIRTLGTCEQVRYWADCLFGMDLVDLVVVRQVLPDLPGRVKVVLAGGTATSPCELYQALKRLIPAHLTFEPDDITLNPPSVVGEAQ